MAASRCGFASSTPSGTSVPLSVVAKIAEETRPSRIERRDQARVGYVRIWIEAEQEGSTAATTDELMAALRDAHPDVEVRREP